MVTKKVLLIQGGLGGEREVSLSTGRNMAQALKRLNYSYKVLDAGPDLPAKLSHMRPDYDVALLALHGQYAEDGLVQGLCEYLKLPYTGSGVLGSAMAMDKAFSKSVLSAHGILIPEWQQFNFYQGPIQTEFKMPVVVKAARSGSSLGVSIVEHKEHVAKACQEASKYDSTIVIEKFIEGHDVTVGLVGGDVLTPIQVVPKKGFYDYKNKYTSGNTDYLLPAPLSEEQTCEVKRLAQKAFVCCQMRSYARVDFRFDGKKFYAIEVNSLPGLTETSLVPQAAAHDGIAFDDLINRILQSASLDYQQEPCGNKV